MSLKNIDSIKISFIPHSKQRYETVGDWIVKKNSIEIKVSQTGHRKYDILVAVHELIESILCLYRGVSQKEVDDFDMAFEEKRTIDDTSEPGDDPDAPYRYEHHIASLVELLLSYELDVYWDQYENTLQNL